MADDRGREGIGAKADVPGEVLLELSKLSDLVRASYVGSVFARLFYEAGVDTLAKLIGSEPEELCWRMGAVNDEMKLTRANLPSAEDMAAGLEIYKMIPRVIEYSMAGTTDSWGFSSLCLAGQFVEREGAGGVWLL